MVLVVKQYIRDLLVVGCHFKLHCQVAIHLPKPLLCVEKELGWGGRENRQT
jgi:hypothetical protein